MLFGPTVALIELLFYCKHIKKQFNANNPTQPVFKNFFKHLFKNSASESGRHFSE